MLKAKAGDMLVLGLSADNVQKLMEADPIYFQGDKIGFTEKDIVICYAETSKHAAPLPVALELRLEESKRQSRAVVLLQISKMSIDQLKNGGLIHLTPEETGKAGIGILIFYGETNEDLKKRLYDTGYVRPETREILPTTH